MKKTYIIIIIIFSLILTFSTAFAQENIEDLYAKVLEYYGLAQEEHEKGEYIKSYEYSQMANSIFGDASIEIYMQLAAIMLNDLEKQVSDSISELGNGQGVANYNQIINSYNSAKELHNKFNEYTANDDHTLIQSTFEDARDYYQASVAMLSGEDNANNSNITTTTTASQNSIDEANEKFLYLTRNEILNTKDSSYKSLKSNIDKMNNEKSQSLADENIKTMNSIIIDNDIQKMFDYADKGIAKANSMGRDTTDSDEYKKILAMIDAAKEQYNNKDYNTAAANIAQALVSMESECSIFKKLPETYTVVKRSGALTDSFWRISGYDFVYSDREKWPTLYNNNQDKVNYKGDPRFIEPGIVLNIANITGEPREGHYNLRDLYIPITAYYYLDAASYSSNRGNSNSTTDTSNADEEAIYIDETEYDYEEFDNTNDNHIIEEVNSIDNDNDSNQNSEENSIVNVINEDDVNSQSSSGITVQSY